jgi:putative transcriptional regulator
MSEIATLTNHFLIAMPTLEDRNFKRTVTLVCQHSHEGAMGIVINRAIDLKLGDILQQLDISSPDRTIAAQPVFLGGPVHNNRGFVIHEPLGDWESTLSVTDTVGVSTSRDILAAIAANRGPDRYLVALGYAGWDAGQLEREMAENAWLSSPASREVLFELALEHRWSAAAGLVGVDIAMLSSQAGHA